MKNIEIEKAIQYSFKLLKIRDRSILELKNKLKEKKFSNQTIDEIISYLKENNYLNDENFAYNWAETRVNSKYCGKLKIYYELKQKGIDNSIINDVINNIYEKYNEFELGIKFLNKKFGKNKSIDKQKLINALIRNGFEFELAEKIVNNF